MLRIVVAIALVLSASNASAQSTAPEKVVTLADVQAVLGGKFEGREVEPGIYNYEENDGPRVVQIWIDIDSGKSVPDLKAHLLQQGDRPSFELGRKLPSRLWHLCTSMPSQA